MIPAGFHFLRPEWLLALVPAALLAVLAWRRIGTGGNAWATLVDAHLLRHLALGAERGTRKWPVAVLLAGWVLASLAMAGPAWRQLPTPALDRLDPTVIVLSLAQSMNAQDQSPTRFGAARHKVEDILRRMRGGQMGLVIYSDRPFVAAPLTEDARVIGLMVPELATDLMPVLNDRPDLAIAKAVELLQGADAPAGRIVLITDGAGDDAKRTEAAAAAAAKAGYQVSVIGVGGEAETPYLIYDGTALRTKEGTAVTTRLDAAGLARVAAAGGGAFTPARVDGADLDRIYAARLGRPVEDLLKQSGLSADQWEDMGPFLLLGVLLIAPLAFRRGWIAVLLAALPLLGAPLGREARAADALSAEGWRDLWRTPDQQGADAFARQDYAAAAGHFEDPAWRAGALYRAGDYAAAADAYARIPGGDYNRGNALARAGKLEEAIAAYDTALEADPKHQDAAYNRELLRKLLEKEEQQKQQQGEGGGSGKDQSQGGGQDKDKGKDSQQGQNNQQGKDGQQKPDQGKQDQDKKEQDQQKQSGDRKPPEPPQNTKADDKNKDDRKDQDKKDPGKDQADQAPPKPEPSKPEPSKPEPQKPDPQKAGGQTPPSPPPPPPGRQAGPQPPAPQPQQAPPPEAPPPAAAAALARAKAEEDQTKEQMLRMVPDDPVGLLRARIRNHYFGTPPAPVPQ
ncbi:VWA domain-containing protein [Xanthobacter pseudotagetidis]|uniref:VWA domain-containing protein n=1 Tax=Xanthobacter pseudotagetidis TaxID=3119911 RepID=UPI0037262EC7